MLRKQITAQEVLAVTLALETMLKVILGVQEVKIEVTMNAGSDPKSDLAS